MWNRIKNLTFLFILALSVLVILTNQGSIEQIKNEAERFWILSAILIISEICFIVGALVMLSSISGEVFSGGVRKTLLMKAVYARKNLKLIASRALSSKTFGFGFWLNFGGALGTSTVLAIAVISVVPVTGIGLLILIGIDLIATLAWRIPVHKYRNANRKL